MTWTVWIWLHFRHPWRFYTSSFQEIFEIVIILELYFKGQRMILTSWSNKSLCTPLDNLNNFNEMYKHFPIFDLVSNSSWSTEGDYLISWLVGCFGTLRQYFSLYRAVSQREREREESKNVQANPPAPTASEIRPCLIIIQIVGHPALSKL